jgi:hypothetical protein
MAHLAQQLDPHDEAAIRSVILGYVAALDGRDFNRIADAFTETAHFENTFERYIPGGEAFTGVMPAVGGEEIATSVGGLMSSLDATQHFLGAIWLEATTEGVTTRTQIIAHHHLGSDFYHTGGTYIDTFIRTEAGWRIDRRVLHTSWTTGEPSVVTGT